MEIRTGHFSKSVTLWTPLQKKRKKKKKNTVICFLIEPFCSVDLVSSQFQETLGGMWNISILIPVEMWAGGAVMLYIGRHIV